jgi:hypothetical protein
MEYPVNDITYIQILIWCNAYTEWYNYKNGTNMQPVYTDRTGNPLRSAMVPLNPQYTGSFPNSFLKIYYDEYLPDNEDIIYYLNNGRTVGDGFRLPTPTEWELAARWNGTDSKNTVTDMINDIIYSEEIIKFTKGNSASGAKDNVANLYETHLYAYINENSNLKTNLSKRKKPNALGLYDMSGNLAEYVYNMEYIDIRGVDFPFAMTKGGSFMFEHDYMAIGRWVLVDATAYNYFYGFRIAKNK